MSNTFDKLSVLDSFIEEVNSYLPEIESNLEKLAHSPSDMDALEEMYRRSHTIGGSASMMDFPGLAHVAHGMEDILGDALDGLTILDESTIGLLQRSLGRLHRLVEGIRPGIDEESIIAEDDADYAQYRAKVEPSLPNSRSGETVSAHSEQLPQELDAPSTPQYFEPSGSSSLPSFEEVLASFRTPSVSAGEDIGWPEDAPSSNDQYNNAIMQQPQIASETPHHAVDPEIPASSAWDELVNTTRASSSSPQQSAYNPQAQEYIQPQEEAIDENSYEAATRMPAYEVPTQSHTVSHDMYDQLPDLQEHAQRQDEEPLQEWTYEPEQPRYESSSQTWGYEPGTQTPGLSEYEAPVQPSRMPELTQQDNASAQDVLWAAESESYNQFPQYASEQQQQYEPGMSEQDRPSFMSDASQQAAVNPWHLDMPSEIASSTMMPSTYEDLRQETQALEYQAASLRNIVVQLRSSMSLIEEQRREFKSFLDGSKDALDRMEDWAGQAMGLNLRNSPEQVRRYLPLSVMWVANSKMKKVLDQLHHIAGGVEVTDEQFVVILQQLQNSLASFTQTSQQPWELKREPGWTSWEMRVASDSNSLRERVMFERQGDPEALRADLEAQIRGELEQQIREEVRREYEQMHAPSSGPPGNFSIKDIEARLRSEIEIQVRREFLNQFAQSAEAAQAGTQPPDAEKQFPAPGDDTMASSLPLSLPPSMAAPGKLAVHKASASSPMTDFGDEAVEIFRAEAEEHLQTISMYVADLEKDSANRELIQGIRRATHTLKGAAGMMGFRPIADLCHVSEDLLDSIMEGTASISPDALSLIFDTAETLDALITGRNSDGLSDESRVQILRQRYAELLGERAVSASARPIEEDLAADVVDDHLDDHAPAATDVVVGERDAGSQMQRGTHGDLTVRVRLPKLDELVNLFGEVLVNRSVLEERIQRLARLISDVGVSSNRLREVGQKLESRFEAVMLPSGRTVQALTEDANTNQSLLLSAPPGQNGERSHLSEFDELELDRYTEFHQIARGLSESVSDMTTLSTEMHAIIRESESLLSRENRLNTSFQDRLMKVRLVPLSNMTPRLYRAAYSVAIKQHKEIDFVFEGDETKVDRTVFEEISGPLLHLIRNAVNHAIETPQQRLQRGKSPAGLIKVSAAYEGNQIIITVRDDGTGIDTEGVRRTAISRNLIRPDQTLSESDLIDLIFQPGFSTADVLSEESGRGVGLDVVRDSVSRLRGTLVVESTPGQGTAFTMTFPTSLAIQSVMMIRVAGQQFAIPTASVAAIGRYDSLKHTTTSGQPAVMVQNEIYPLHSLAQYLALPVHHLDERAQLLLVRAAGHRVALIVDEIKGKSDIVMKNLGPHLRQVHGVAGGTILGNGRVVLVLELNDLLKGSALVGRNGMGTSAAALNLVRQRVDVAVPLQNTPSSMRPVESRSAPPERGKHVLVVDDSPSVRRVVSNMLKQHGWEVQAARDGQEALEMISYETPAAVLLDIEMPRMDGYELISTIRAQAQYRTLPLVVLTSRAATKHKQRAMSLGASAYVVKPYQDEELINILKSLVYGASIGGR